MCFSHGIIRIVFHYLGLISKCERAGGRALPLVSLSLGSGSRVSCVSPVYILCVSCACLSRRRTSHLQSDQEKSVLQDDAQPAADPLVCMFSSDVSVGTAELRV